MAQPLTNFEQPGFFSEIQESPSLFLLPGSVKVVGLIGTGKPTRSVLQESLTRADASKFEVLANPAQSIDRVYSNSVFQYPTSSYSLSMTGTVAEGLGYNVNTKTLVVSVGGGSNQTITFAGVDPISLASVVTQINAVLTGAKAQAVSAHLKLISGDGVVGDGGTEIRIVSGSALSALGFTSGQVTQDLDWTASFSSTDANVRPLDTQKYYVDYETPKVAADLAPQSYFSLSQVAAAYGNPSSSSTVSLGAQAAFANGASIVTIRQLDPNYLTLSVEVASALSDLEAQKIDVLVPMTTDTSLWPQYLTHVSKMSSKLERMERRAILSVDETSGRISITGGGTTWTSLMSDFVPGSGLEPKRIEVTNPGSMLVTVPSGQIKVDGTYGAAALAGAKCSPAVDSATPMTRKALASIDQLIFPDLLRSEKNVLTSLGVTVLESSGALIVVRRNVTADSTTIANQEPSIVFSIDDVLSQMREALENRFVGQKIISGSTSGEVVAATNTFLLRFVADELISAFRNVTAVQNKVEPRQFDVSFEVLPIFPFLWGTIDLTITIS